MFRRTRPEGLRGAVLALVIAGVSLGGTAATGAATPPIPSMTVSVRSDLRDQQSVHVTGTNLVAGSEVALFERYCHYCDAFLTPYTTVPPSGTVAFDAALRRYLRDDYDDSNDPPIDCAWGLPCSLSIVQRDSNEEDGYRELVSTELGFRRTGSPPLDVVPAAAQPLPAVVQTIAHGRGLAPGVTAYLAQCWSTDSGGGCTSIDGAGPAVADANGNVTFDVWLRRVDGRRDCLATGTTCALRMWAGQPYAPPPTVTVPIAFDPTSPPPAGPVLTVAPSTGLGVAPTVTIRGTGFRANRTVNLTECRTIESTPFPSCSSGGWGDAPSGLTITAPDGTFTTTLTLRRYLSHGLDQPVADCAVVGCRILASEEYLFPAAPVPVSFATTSSDPVLSLRGAWAVEGTSASPTPVTAHAELDRPATRPVRFRVAAPANEIDVTLNLDEFEIPVGARSVDLPLGVRADSWREAPVEVARYAPLVLEGAQLDPTASDLPIVIIDDDPLPRMRADDALVREGDPNHLVSVRVHLSDGNELGAAAQFRTVRGTARPGRDYVSTRGTLRFSSYSTDGYVQIPIVDDHRREGTEYFDVRLRRARGAVRDPLVARVYIGDDDSAPDGPPG